jgi:P27 family predicted phage terminase small subunit
MPKAKTIEPPADISGEALSEWQRVAEALGKMGRKLREVDRSILAQYCRAWIIARDAFSKVQAEGSTIVYSNGMPGPSPHLKIFREMSVIVRGLANDLGLTPASRNFDSAEKKDKPFKLPKF